MDVVTCGKNDLSAGPKENATTGKSTFVGIGTSNHCNTKLKEAVAVVDVLTKLISDTEVETKK